MITRKAVVLAAGLGTRLRPLTLVRPKPLLPIWGVPMLERVVRMLERWGVDEVAVNAHWRSSQISMWAAERKGKARITVSVEDEILGTGGALRPLAGFVGNDPFWLVNGDVVIEDLDPEPMERAFEASGGFAGCWMSSSFGPRTVEADPKGRICNWKSDFPGDSGTYTYCGCALLSPTMLSYLPEEKSCSIVSAYEKAMMTDARFVVGVDPDDAYWADAGTFESYLEAHIALDQDRFESNPNVLFEGVKLLESAELAGCVATGGLIGGTFERTALVGIGQIEDDRLEALTRALGWLPEDTAGVFLGARGSDRSFWRLVHGEDRAIAVSFSAEKRPENARYAAHSLLLSKAGVPVPRVLADIPEKCVLALEDCGENSLERMAARKGADLVKLYAPVVDALRIMHEDATPLALDAELERPFDAELYAWERELFEKHCLQDRYGYEKMPDAVRAELEGVAAELARQRPVLLHRDFQSSNVLFRPDGSFAFIDYQGMRLGPAAYDLASLLYDPYAPLGEKERAELSRRYQVEKLACGAVQRLVQALGAFGRLAAIGHKSFERHIPRALDNLLAAADEADLDAIGALAEDLIAKEEIRLGHFHHHQHAEEEE